MKEDIFDILKNIKPVEVPVSLYQKIEKRLERNRVEIVPLYKVGIAASLVLGLMLSQLYFIKSFSNSQEHYNNEIELVQINNNLFYYE